MEGQLLADKYEITRLLGRGGMGAVYEARNHLGKRLAVKLLLNPELARDPALVQRFFREAKASAAIESEHIVEVYDTGVDPQTGFPFIVMEMLKGEDLEHTIQRVGALNATAAARVVSQAARGLAEAHTAGIIHRDIKPANVFMTMRGPGELVVKILDFGIAKQVEELQGQSAGLTKTGSMLGTPLYMSPEQARGLRTIDARSDIWSLGVCLYEALSGHTPWGAIETLGDLILAICTQDIKPLHEAAPWVPRELSALVHRALAREPNRRTATCRALIDELAPFTSGSVSIAPEMLVGVAEELRVSATRPSALAQNTISGATSMASSQVRTNPGLGQTGRRTFNGIEKKSRVAMYASIGVAGLALAIGGTLALSKMLHRDHDPSTATSASNGSDPADPPADPPANPAPDPPQATPSSAPIPVVVPAPVVSTAPSVPIKIGSGRRGFELGSRRLAQHRDAG